MKTEQMVLQENVDELVKLQKENPDARVMCFVSDDCCNGDYSYQLSQFGKPRLETLWLVDETWVNDEEYVMDHVYNQMDVDNLSHKEIDEKIKQTMESEYEPETAIVIYIYSM